MTKSVKAPILLAALGYFVDIYDLILFSIVRIKSLQGIGVPEADILGQGVMLLNMQMAGMLLGGILWGVLGDKKGRLSVLFGSIFLYSVANIANGMVQSVQAYAVLRLIAGIGLAGELGAGITLVSEIMPKETRGYGTMIVAGVGILGGVVAGLVGDLLNWRHAYFVGGAMGLALLCLRIGVYESGMFEAALRSSTRRGDLGTLLSSPAQALKYVCSIAIGVPIWFVLAIPITLAPEFGRALGMPVIPSPAKAVMYCYLGCAIGDFASGGLSQMLGSRKKVALIFIGATAALVMAYLTARGASLTYFYSLCFLLGFTSGYWAVFVTMASEQFGTNIRSTVTTTAPNFVRGAVVPMTLAFQAAREPWGIVAAAAVVGGTAFAIALAALTRLEETHGKDLNYCEG